MIKLDEVNIVCYCQDVSIDTIKQAILNGAKTVEDITEDTSAGMACGTCIERIEDILDINMRLG